MTRKYQRRSLLTVRQEDAIDMLSQGLTAKEIAERELISESSVWSRLQHAYRRLGAKNAPHAVALWIQSQSRASP